mmetsp:Transcript_35402/g.78580  ORF Transcript_35402/g.78580 Transcript_35402/m.78580 type:complete len:317 (+) Transcript_35402:80-1030(+)
MIGPFLPEELDASNQTHAAGDKLPLNEQRILKGHEGPVLAVRFNRTGAYCFSCGKDRNVVLWNPHNGVRVKTYAGHGYEVRDVAVARDNSVFASCGGDKQLFLWDVSSARVIRKFKGHDNTINAVTYAAEDDVLVTAGYDQCIKVWDCKSRSLDPIQTMKMFEDSVTGVVAHSSEIVGCSVDGTLRRFDIRMGRVYIDSLHHPVTSLAISHDGMCILAACLDSTLRLLDKSSGELLASYTGHLHQAVKMDCTLTPSDAHVVGASETGEVMYWDLVEAAVVHRFKAHSGVVCSLDMHPEGGVLLTSSVDGTVKVWTS